MGSDLSVGSRELLEAAGNAPDFGRTSASVLGASASTSVAHAWLFNPTYGQGMSIAALEAHALRDCLRGGIRRLAPP
jgi:hypothetical protein